MRCAIVAPNGSVSVFDRAAIFVHSPEQRTIAQTIKDEIEVEDGRRLATELAPLARFYRAEDYHQRYLERRGAAVV